MPKTPSALAVDYYNISIIGLDILYEAALMDPGSVEDLANIARQVVELTGKRTARLSPRTMDELCNEADRSLARKCGTGSHKWTRRNISK